MASPAQAAPSVEVNLSLFGGTDTEVAPSDLPEGLSPDNQDVIFLPGEVASRPCLRRMFPTAFPGGVSVTYAKTYVQPNGRPLTLVLTSDGKLWKEDVVFSAFDRTQIGSVPPTFSGTYAQSISAFGREYIAFSDLLHGQGVPLQFDGTNLDRVTQDGPGIAPVVVDDPVAPVIPASPAGLGNTTAEGFIPKASPLGLTQVGNLVTATASAATRIPDALKAGDALLVTGAGVGGYNGTFTVASVNHALNQLTYVAGASGLAASGGGSVVTGLARVNVDPALVGLTGKGTEHVTIAGATNASWNGTWEVRTLFPGSYFLISVNAVLGASGGGTVSAPGSISVGAHGICQFFIFRSGAISEPSPIAYWTAAGGKRAIVSNLAIGPSNVIARGLGLTGAGGGNFFNIPATITLPNASGTPTVIPALVIPDNTSSQATIDFSDTSLFAGIAIDQIGNDLFDQIVLGSPIGFFAFADRLVTWGDWNKTENFRNMGFDGGWLSATPTVPTWWTQVNGDGALVAGGAWAGGFAWQIVGDGVTAVQGLLTQPAYQDSFGDAILQPNTNYQIRFWGQGPGTGAFVGTVVFEFYSATGGGVLCSQSANAAGLPVAGAFQVLNLTPATPATIPSDTVLRIYGNNLGAGVTVLLDENEIIFTENPYRKTAQCSYVVNPEGFAQTTGNLGPSDDSSPIQNFSLQRNVGLLRTSSATHEFQDNSFEPGDGNNAWPINALTHSVGALSLRSCDPGQFGTGDAAEDWDIIASKNGPYLHIGARFYKIGQELSRTLGTAPDAVTWDDINWPWQHTIWVKNNVNERLCYIGVPVGTATAPNIMFQLDYRELETAEQIGNALPIHIALSGKMKSSDLTRKWTRWNVKANCAEILVRPVNVLDIFLGGGAGVNPGTNTGFGNLYSLDPTKFTDDDYGAMQPYYVTYFLVDNDAELAFQLGSGRHSYQRISAFIAGIGMVSFIPLVNSMNNPMPESSPRILSADTNIANALPNELEWTTSITGQRVAFRIQVQPLPGTTDVQMRLQKWIVGMSKDVIALCRGMAI